MTILELVSSTTHSRPRHFVIVLITLDSLQCLPTPVIALFQLFSLSLPHRHRFDSDPFSLLLPPNTTAVEASLAFSVVLL